MTAAAPAPLGVVAHYNLLERLDPAGPGDLYRARDTRRGRTVAVRLLPPDFVAGPAERRALTDQARTLVTVSHPNVTTLFDVGEHEGRVFLAFEFLRGQSLRAEMAGRPMNIRRALEIAIQIADAVAQAHAGGFVHGGLSPESIIVTAKGHAKIPVFELASSTGFERTDGGVKLRDYDSPEEARGEPADDRSDIYSVGAMLYEMVTARRPPHRGAAAASASNPHVPRELDEMLQKAVAPNPELRYQTAAAFAAELRSLSAIVDVRGASDEPDLPGDEPRRSLLVPALLLLLTAAAVAAWWFMRV